MNITEVLFTASVVTCLTEPAMSRLNEAGSDVEVNGVENNISYVKVLNRELMHSNFIKHRYNLPQQSLGHSSH